MAKGAKTKSSAKRRFRITACGKVRMFAAKRRHNLRKRSQRMKRQSRKGALLQKCDAKKVKRLFLPHG